MQAMLVKKHPGVSQMHHLAASDMLFSVRCFPDSKVHGANMGATWVLSALDGPHVGPMNLAFRVMLLQTGSSLG